MEVSLWSLAFALLAALATLGGGALVVAPAQMRRSTHIHLIAFGAGFMLAAAILAMIPASLERLPAAPLWVLAGYVLAHIFEHAFTSHFHFGEETHGPPILSPAVGVSALFGLSLHAFFDGVTISSGFMITPVLGLTVALAVVLHKVPEGVTIASVMRASGRSKAKSFQAAVMLGVATLAGTLAMQMLAGLRAVGLALSAGIALYVAASDLIPEVNKEEKMIFSLSGLAGLGFYFLVGILLRALDWS